MSHKKALSRAVYFIIVAILLIVLSYFLLPSFMPEETEPSTEDLMKDYLNGVIDTCKQGRDNVCVAIVESDKSHCENEAENTKQACYDEYALYSALLSGNIDSCSKITHQGSLELCKLMISGSTECGSITDVKDMKMCEIFMGESDSSDCDLLGLSEPVNAFCKSGKVLLNAVKTGDTTACDNILDKKNRRFCKGITQSEISYCMSDDEFCVSELINLSGGIFEKQCRLIKYPSVVEECIKQVNSEETEEIQESEDVINSAYEEIAKQLAEELNITVEELKNLSIEELEALGLSPDEY